MDFRLIVSFVVAGLLILAVAIGSIAFVRTRYRVDWRYLGYGAIVFFLSQVVTRIPTLIFLQVLLRDALQSSPFIQFAWIAGLALTAGVFEEVGRYIGYVYLFHNGKNWPNSLMYGLEAVLIGAGGMLTSLISYVIISNTSLFGGQLFGANAEQIGQVQAAFAAISWWLPLLGGFERLGALVIQVSLAVIVLQSFLRNTRLWLYAAIAYHVVVDFVAVMVVQRLGSVAAEGAVAAFALISLYFILALRPDARRVSTPRHRQSV